MSNKYVIEYEKVAYWISFEANTKLGFYRFMDAFNEAAAYAEGIDVDLLDDELSNVLENKSKYFKNFEHYLDTYSFAILNDISNIEKRNLKILDYIEVSNVIRKDMMFPGCKDKKGWMKNIYDDNGSRHRYTFKGFESILNI